MPVNPATKSAIDSYLGAGSTKEWESAVWDQNAKEAKAESWDSSFNVDTYRDDRIALEMVGDDYTNAMNLIAAGQKLSRAQVAKVHDVYRMLIDLLALDSEICDAVDNVRLLQTAKFLDLSALDRQIVAVRSRLKTLGDDLRVAQNKAGKAWIPFVYDGAALGATILFPEVALGYSLASGFTSYLAGTYLGSSTSQEVTIGGEANSGGSIFLTCLGGLKDVSVRTKKYAGKGGYVLSVTGLVLDAAAIGEGEGVVKDLQSSIESSQKELDKLVALIDSDSNLLERLMTGLRTTARDARAKRAKVNAKLKSLLVEAGYGADYELTWRYQAGG